MQHIISVKRVREAPTPDDGVRLLVDRLWPRGVKKESLHLDGWVRDAAPSDALRRWFNHDPARWEGFRTRYFSELDRRPDVLQQIVDAALKGPVTLLFAAKDTEHNNAVALRDYLTAKAKRRKRG